jgi:hypothetical protein|tara:strand:- start:287 stop:466 length:180 start_codon:yes stop_codon:yes gene_type:complete
MEARKFGKPEDEGGPKGTMNPGRRTAAKYREKGQWNSKPTKKGPGLPMERGAQVEVNWD